MASPHTGLLIPHLLLPLLATLFTLTILASNTISIKAATLIYPFNCSNQIETCNASLYRMMNNNLQEAQIAYFFSVNLSQMKPILHGEKQDYLINVPCSCKDLNGVTGYFYNTSYVVKVGDTFDNVSTQIYSGQAWKVGGEEALIPDTNLAVYLPCGCVESTDTQTTVVTYTVQEHDTLSGIATLLSAQQSGIQSLNRQLAQNPTFIDVGWVLYVPMEKNGTVPYFHPHLRARRSG